MFLSIIKKFYILNPKIKSIDVKFFFLLFEFFLQNRWRNRIQRPHIKYGSLTEKNGDHVAFLTLIVTPLRLLMTIGATSRIPHVRYSDYWTASQTVSKRSNLIFLLKRFAIISTILSSFFSVPVRTQVEVECFYQTKFNLAVKNN